MAENKSNAATVDPGEEYVTVELIWDGEKYKDDVFVSVNGENCLIKRGVPVQIKRKFADVLEQSDKQDRNTKKLIQSYTSQFRDTEQVFT